MRADGVEPEAHADLFEQVFSYVIRAFESASNDDT